MGIEIALQLPLQQFPDIVQIQLDRGLYWFPHRHVEKANRRTERSRTPRLPLVARDCITQWRSPWGGGSVDVILDLHGDEAVDPLLNVILQQADALMRCAFQADEHGRALLFQAWKPLWRRQQETRHGWQKLAEPVSAMIHWTWEGTTLHGVRTFLTQAGRPKEWTGRWRGSS